MRAASRPGLARLWRLALPMSLTRIGLTLMIVVDTMVVGRYGTADLAALAFATLPLHTAQTIGIGFLMGGLVEVSAAVGRGDLAQAGAAWRRSLAYAVAVGLLGVALGVAALPMVLAPGLDPAVADQAHRLILILAGSVPAMLVFTTCGTLLQALGRPAVGVWVAGGANVANLGLDLWLVFGGLGVPPLGADGAAIATLVVRCGMAGAIVLYVWRRLPERRALGRPAWSDHAWRAGRTQRRLGLAEALSMGIESGAFAAMTVFAGRLGAREIAAYTIAINLNMLFFMAAVGVGGAAAVLVAQARGREDAAGMRVAAWHGFALFGAVGGLIAVAMLAVPEAVVAAYTRDPALALVAVPLVAVVGLVSLADGAQRVVANVLRGYGETWLPTASHLVAYVALMVPAGYGLAIVAGLGAYGLVLAIGLASVLASALLFARFIHRSRWRVALDAARAR